MCHQSKSNGKLEQRQLLIAVAAAKTLENIVLVSQVYLY